MTAAAHIHADLGAVSTAMLAGLLARQGYERQFMTGMRSFGGRARCAGKAFTVRLVPARRDLGSGSRFQEAIELVPPGHVMVIDSMRDSAAASIGDLLAMRLAVRGVAGLVTDGAVRDASGLRELELAVYAPAVNGNIRSRLFHVAGVQEPIACAGVTVIPGDTIVADGDGPIVVPDELTAGLSGAARDEEAFEEYVAMRLRAGEPLPGLYPPDEQARADYARWREKGARA